MKSETNLTNARPWNKNSSHNSFAHADVARNKLLEHWASDPVKYAGMQVKVRRMSGDVFVVKTRLHPDFEPAKKEKKKRGKSSRRNKKNSDRRESNVT